MARKFWQWAGLIALLSSCPSSFAFQLTLADNPAMIVPRSRPARTTPLFHVDASLVLIPAQVTTAVGEPVMNLTKDSFRLSEENVEQKITQFAQDDAPVSIGILFDASGSMQNKMKKSCEAASEFFKTANSADEFFLVEFNGRAKLTVPFTPDAGELYSQIRRTRPNGKTSLLDAIFVALAHMKSARNLRKALVVVSDGGDNWSHHTPHQVRDALEESDLELYAMGIVDRNVTARHTVEERNGPKLLKDLSALTGGRYFPVLRLDDLPAISRQIGNELRSQYLLGYQSTNSERDGKYRRVQVQVTAPKDSPDLRVSYRRGYFAAAQ